MTDIVCTLTGDAPRERLAEYARLFAAAFVGRRRTANGVRWSLRAEPGIAEWARDLATRENACCAFLDNAVTVMGDRVVWDVRSVDDPAARAVLDGFYDLPVAPPDPSALPTLPITGPLPSRDRRGAARLPGIPSAAS